MTPGLPPIDPIETLMVAVGLKAIISREVEKFRRSDMREAFELPRDIAAAAKALVDGELRSGKTGAFDYRGTLKDLARGWDPQQVEEMMAQFPPELGQYTSQLVMRAKAIIDALTTDYPQTNYVTATGSINLVPADKKIFKFVQVLEVLCDPMSVFGLMADGALLQTQTAIMRKVYPTLSQAIDAALLNATVTAKAKSKAYELPPLTEIGVRAWFGKGPLSPDALKKSQDAVAAANQRKAAQAAAPTGNAPAAEQTKTQRVEAQA